MEDRYAYSKGYDPDFLEDLVSKETYRPLILNLIYLTNCKNYLELGVEQAHRLNDVKDVVDKCVGVDINDLDGIGDGVIFHNTTTDNFFDKNDDNFDVIFIDADHRFGQVKIDFENSLKILNEFGVIILHDTDPLDTRLLVDDFCSDSYKMVDYVILSHPELNIITLPIHETGLSLVMRKNDRRVNK
jgi:hypothetical protein